MPDERVFGDRLREMLWKRKMTQKELSEKSGVTASAISRYIHGCRLAHTYILVQIADLLDVSCDYLLGRDKYVMKEQGEKKKNGNA